MPCQIFHGFSRNAKYFTGYYKKDTKNTRIIFQYVFQRIATFKISQVSAIKIMNIDVYQKLLIINISIIKLGESSN